MQEPLTHSYQPADTSRPILDLTIGDVLRNAASTAPHRLALVEVAPPGAGLSGEDRTDRTGTYAQLLDDAEHAVLAGRAVRPR
jgi:hypothetical protein